MAQPAHLGVTPHSEAAQNCLEEQERAACSPWAWRASPVFGERVNAAPQADSAASTATRSTTRPGRRARHSPGGPGGGGAAHPFETVASGLAKR
ncbi:MAG: hypothetical protein WKG07_15435 [Hymenobacter sp.]